MSSSSSSSSSFDPADSSFSSILSSLSSDSSDDSVSSVSFSQSTTQSSSISNESDTSESAYDSSSSDSPKKQFAFLTELFEKRGKPGVGGLSYHFLNMINANHITISFYDIDPLSSRTEHYYNSRNNILYRRKKLSKNYAVWQPISLV